ncbi:hypothetical protein PX52LOC_02665 [Limnoglobus roseus]|uniref:Uncharacterized protein n=1 Tax=Limnoglobus roseus TaxID=2598579 RepID=A0A5C1AAH6_9BACT|nr:hypothetical protein PX52LOC_02665 [Limnoglobus roseus]
MPRATVLVIVDRPGEWEVAEGWVERWRDRMAVCPEEPGGCLCCVAWWDVDAPQEALNELPTSLLSRSEWVINGSKSASLPNGHLQNREHFR